jgi:hypothetical protein
LLWGFGNLRRATWPFPRLNTAFLKSKQPISLHPTVAPVFTVTISFASNIQ